MSAMEEVRYTHGGTTLTGLLALPEGPPSAAVAIFPTIMNIAPNVLRRMPMLTAAGYIAFMADHYGEPVHDRAQAHALGTALRADVAHYRARIGEAVGALAAHPACGTLP